MATRVWSGGAATQAQKATITPSALSSAATVIALKLESHTGLTHSISYTTASTNVASAVTGIVSTANDAKNGSAHAWDVVTASDSASTNVLVIADTAGNPYTLTASITSGPGSTQTSVIQANAGPNIFSQAENWVSDTAPTDGDVIIIPASASDAIYGEDTTANQFQGFTVENGCPILIGSLNKPLIIDLKDDSTYYNAELGGIGDPIHMKINNYHQIDVINAGGGSPQDGTYGTNLTGTHDADATGNRGTIYVDVGDGASVGIGANAGETMKANKIVLRSGTAKIGSGVTASTTATALPVEIEGGTHEIEAAMTTYTKREGTCTIRGSGAITTLSEEGGTTNYLSSGTVTNVNIFTRGLVDANRNTSGATFTNTDMWAGSALRDHHKSITFTNDIDLNKCGLPGSIGASITELDLGTDFTVARSTI